MKWKVVVLLLSIVLLSLLYLQYYNKIYENLSEMKTFDTYYSNVNYTDNSLSGKPIISVTNDPDWNYVASNNEPISCDNFCRKVGLTDLYKNCESYNGDIHIRCTNSIGVLTTPSCVKNIIKNKCVVSNS
jgi:hypothetical protein